MYPYYDTAVHSVMRYFITVEIPKNLQAEERLTHDSLMVAWSALNTTVNPAQRRKIYKGKGRGR